MRKDCSPSKMGCRERRTTENQGIVACRETQDKGTGQ
jgi:hypothetical protein